MCEHFYFYVLFIFRCIHITFALINCETTPCANRIMAIMMTWQLNINITSTNNIEICSNY